MFERAEKYVIVVIFLLLGLSTGLSLLRHVPVAYYVYDVALAFDLFFIMLGQFYRTVRKNASIASAATAVGLLLMAGQLIPVFNYLLLPYKFHGVDAVLADVDRKMGFVWASYAITMAQFPKSCALLKFVYQSTFWQIVGMVFLLGLFGRTQEVARMTLATVMGATVTIAIWALMPSSTPAAFETLPADIAAKLQLVVSPDYGAELVRLSYAGVTLVTPGKMLGIVGFPSFHTVMAIIVVWYARSLPVVGILIALLNILMLPAILLHGAHNLVDVFGGVAVATFAIRFAAKAAAAPDPLLRTTTAPQASLSGA